MVFANFIYETIIVELLQLMKKKSSKLRTVVTIKYEIEQNCIQVEKNRHRKKNCTNSQKKHVWNHYSPTCHVIPVTNIFCLYVSFVMVCYIIRCAIEILHQ